MELLSGLLRGKIVIDLPIVKVVPKAKVQLEVLQAKVL